MLWIEPGIVICVALLGGAFGGCLMALTNRHNNKFNMRCMEDYWNADIKRLQSHIEVLSQKISTISVVNPVSNQKKGSFNKGYKSQRHFNHR